MADSKKAAETRRLAEALRANLRRRKDAAGKLSRTTAADNQAIRDSAAATPAESDDRG